MAYQFDIFDPSCETIAKRAYPGEKEAREKMRSMPIDIQNERESYLFKIGYRLGRDSMVKELGLHLDIARHGVDTDIQQKAVEYIRQLLMEKYAGTTEEPENCSKCGIEVDDELKTGGALEGPPICYGCLEEK